MSEKLVITHDGPAPTDEILVEVQHRATKLRFAKQAGGYARATKAYDLSDGGQVYVLDLEFIWKAHVIPPTAPEYAPAPVPYEPYPTPPGAPPIVGILSGAMKVTTIETRPVLWPGEEAPQDRDVIVNDKFELTQHSSIYEKPMASHKLAVGEYSPYAPLRGLDPNRYSQFDTIEPGNYTGSMAPLVQLLLGIGRIVRPDFEEVWRKQSEDRPSVPSVVRVDDSQPPEFADTEDIPNAATDRVDESIQITYDWRWNRTHGVSWSEAAQDFGAKQQPYLVEVGQRSINAMLMPLDELSKSPDAQEHYERVYPGAGDYAEFKDGKTLFEAFGGLPLGERQPGAVSLFNKWVRAGIIVKAPQTLADFYSGLAFGTGFGWSFDDDGSRAINTCYRYDGEGRRVSEVWDVELRVVDKASFDLVRNPLEGPLIAALGLTDPVDLFKARRVVQEVAESLIQSESYEDFDALQVSPDFTFSAQPVKIKEGYIDYGGFQCPEGVGNECLQIDSPHFKYYEPFLGQVLHFDFSVADGVEALPMDGPLVAGYVNNQAEILQIWWGHGGSQSTTNIDTRQPCQFVGTWESGYRTTENTVVNAFFTTSHDFRKRIDSGGYSIKTTTGYRIGDADFASLCHFFGMTYTLTKRFFGYETWERESVGGVSISTSAACAANHRNMFFICEEEQKQDVKKSHGRTGRLTLGSSGTYKVASIYNFIFHWVNCGTTCSGDPLCALKTCKTITGNPESCHGVEPPSELEYSVCCIKGGHVTAFCSEPYDLVVVSPVDNAVIQSAYYTYVPSIPPGFTQHEPTKHQASYKVWAFGDPILHNEPIAEYEVEQSHEFALKISDPAWWRCVFESCPVVPWRVLVNFFGPRYVSTSEEFGTNHIERGSVPSVSGRTFFGPVS